MDFSPVSVRGFSGVDPVNTSIAFCKVRWTLRTISNAVCLTCVCLAAIDRYFLSCSNVRRHRLITVSRARRAVLIAIVFWSAFFSSYAVYYTFPKPSSCGIADPVFAYFASYFNLIHYSLLPLTVLTIFCGLTWRNLGQQPGTYLRGGVRLYDQVTRMLIAQSFGICVTSVPNMIWQIYSVTTNSTTKDSLRQAQENLLNTIGVLIGFSTHAITFYVYLLASATFRKNVKDIFFRTQRIAPARNTDMVRITLTHEDQKATGPSARYWTRRTCFSLANKKRKENDILVLHEGKLRLMTSTWWPWVASARASVRILVPYPINEAERMDFDTSLRMKIFILRLICRAVPDGFTYFLETNLVWKAPYCIDRYIVEWTRMKISRDSYLVSIGIVIPCLSLILTCLFALHQSSRSSIVSVLNPL